MVFSQKEHQLFTQAFLEDSSLGISRRGTDDVLKVKRLDSTLLGVGASELGRIEDLEKEGGEGNVSAGATDDTEERMKDVESEREVSRGRKESILFVNYRLIRYRAFENLPNSTQSNLNKGIDQWLQRTFQSRVRLLVLHASRTSQYLTPEIDTVDILPVVNSLEGLLVVTCLAGGA